MMGLVQMGFPRNAAPFVIGLPAFLASFVCSGYCGDWLAKRLSRSPGLRAIIAVVATLLLVAANLIAAVGACSAI